MLVQPRYKHPSLPESVQILKDRTQAELQQFKLPDQDSLTDAQARIGRPMADDELISRVRALTRYSVFAEDSINWPGGSNFYRIVNGEKKCLSAPFLKGYLPEYTVIHLDKRGLPDQKTVGWREVLQRLMLAGVLTLKQVKKAFGEPSPTSNNLYTRNIQRFNN